MNRTFKILHIEDVRSDAELVERMLKKSGITFEKVIVDTKEEYLAALDDFKPDIILSDHSLPSFNSLEALRILKQKRNDVPFILITSTVSEEFAVNVMKEGATDYILKDRMQRLPSAIANALNKFQSDTERQLYLNRIVKSEALFTKAEGFAEFGTWSIDVLNNAISWSAGLYPLLGFKKYETEPDFASFLQNIHPADRQPVEELFGSAFAIKQSSEIDFRVIDSGGSVRYIHSQFEPEFILEETAAIINGFSQDVTRGKLAQIEIERHLDEISAASERQSAILNALPPGIVLLNESGKIIAINESWKKYTLSNNLGIPRYGIDCSYSAIAEKATGADAEASQQITAGIKDIIAGGAGEFRMEYSCYIKSKKSWFQLIAAPLKDKTKKGAVVLHNDITGRKIAEQALLQSEANLRTVFENTDVAYVLCNTEQKVVSFNSQAAQLCFEQFGRKLRPGTNAFGYFPQNKIPDVKDAIEKSGQQGRITYEALYKTKEGGTRWYEVSWITVADEHTMPIGFILAFKDITERKIADIERDRITADLVQRNKDLEQFTYMVSHNLRAPVANIMGLTDMLNSFEMDYNENQEIRNALSASIKILDQVIMDINQVLQVSRPANEKPELVFFRDLVDDIAMSLNSLIKKENAHITYDFNSFDRFAGIKSYLYSIFYNLMLNSIKYRRPDVSPELHISARKRNGQMEILFKDNGKGIEEHNLKHLFGIYKRFDTTTEGKGMGLFMVKMQVENLGGKISVESKPGEGSTFKIEFPQVERQR